MVNLFDALGGREWLKRCGARLDGAAFAREVRLVLSRSGCGANRAGVTARWVNGGPVYAVTWWRVDGEEAEPVRELDELTPAQIARAVERDAAAELVA